MDFLSVLSTVMIVYGVWTLGKIAFNFYSDLRHQVDFEQRFRQHLEHIIHVVKQERDGDMYYWYDNDSDDFLAQGRTWEEVVGVLRERFPEHIFVLNQREMIMGPEFEIVQYDPDGQLTHNS
jgi:hypothetical protein